MIRVYDSFAEVPKVEPGIDGDDSLVPAEYAVTHVGELPRLAAIEAADHVMVVPYRRIVAGDSGRHVVALARALWRAHYLYKAPGIGFTSLYGIAKQSALERFKRDHGLTRNTVYDREAHQLLARYYDAYALALLHAGGTTPTKEDRLRLRVKGAGNFMFNHRLQLAYTQNRPWPVTLEPILPFPGTDCSGGKAWCDHDAGAPEPSGYSGWGYGNTTSQLDRYRALGRAHPPSTFTVSRAKIGDPIYFQGHVAWIIEQPGGLVWSFGHYPISLYSWTYRDDAVAVCDLV